jgi:hypothetical protein
MTDQVTISLDPERQALAREEAARLKITLEAYVTRLVHGNLPVPVQSSSTPPIQAIFGIGASLEFTDIGHDRHRMIAEAVVQEHLRKTRHSS